MSLVVTVCTREGIAMAADSRLTASFTRDQQAAVQTIISTPSSDSASKLFMAAGGIGISTYGLATVNGPSKLFSAARRVATDLLSYCRVLPDS